MSNTIRYGIFGTAEVEVDDDGFVEVPVVVQESGLYGGAPPPELRIVQVLIPGMDEVNRDYVAKMNTNTDLPYYLAKAKIKIVSMEVPPR